MARTNLSKNVTVAESLVMAEVAATPNAAVDPDAMPMDVNGATEDPIAPDVSVESAAVELAAVESAAVESAAVESVQDIDDLINALKALLSTVEKLQKVRLEVGDIKPLIIRMLDGEIMTGEELEQLKTGVAGLFRLTRAYTDHQAALSKAQPARTLLDDVLKVRDVQP